MMLTSPTIPAGGKFPKRFTGFGENVSPPLNFADLPAGAQSLALIMEQQHSDRDAWVCWVIFNLPPSVDQLLEEERLPPDARNGRNHWGKVGYHGPQFEGEHVYVFRLFALDCKLYLPEGAENARVLDAMGGHILATAELSATFSPDTADLAAVKPVASHVH